MSKKLLFEINEEAEKYYQSHISSEEGKKAIRSLEMINLVDDTILNYRLGYSGKDEQGLTNHLREIGYSDDQIQEAGLSVSMENGELEDVFQNRLIFPIIDDEDRVVGFSGRLLEKGGPVYLNSRSTDVFDKNKRLFGLNIAKDTSADYMILCEGYMDVISLNQAGFDMATATLGVKFTSDQANLLKKYTSKVFVCFDTDTAGNKGADFAISIIVENGMKGLKIDLSPYKDPLDMKTKGGADAFRERLEE